MGADVYLARLPRGRAFPGLGVGAGQSHAASEG